jgi:peptidoglycan/xylan/chitin deacetylase (PgdA/CDA1 family)
MAYKKTLVFAIAVCLLLSADFSSGHAEQVPVLVYHDIVDSATPEPGRFDQISMNRFERQMKYLSENGYMTISLDELVSLMKGGSVPRKSIVLTFDDGWKSLTKIIPILKQYHFRASFFIFPGKGVAQPSYMEWNDILAIAKDPDFQIESHTMTHPWAENSNLVTWIEGETVGRDAKDVEYELKESKYILEKVLNKKVKYLAWPCGLYNDKLIEMAKDVGYEALFTTDDGANTRGDDVFRVKRLIIDGFCDMDIFKQGLQDYKDYKNYECETKGKLPTGYFH